MDKILQNRYGRIDHTGKKFGRLTALHYSHTSDKRAYWICRCDCGNTKVVRGKELSNGDTKSCGCLGPEMLSKRNFKHGETHKTLENRIWSGMKNRCTNPNNQKYYRYGARGIKVCDRWMESYENFLADMGRAPGPNYSIERDDNDGDYSPTNCRWATNLEQANNKSRSIRITIGDRTQTLSQWARELNIPYSRIYARIKRYGYTPGDAILA